MTCQECELLLAEEQNVDEHLSECAECRSLAEQLRLNRDTFESLAADPLPQVSPRVMSQIRAHRIARWALAAAAMISIALFITRRDPPKPAPAPFPIAQQPSRERQRPGPVSAPKHHVAKRPQKKSASPLMVKMLTEDPDVVIYWQFESEEENQ